MEGFKDTSFYKWVTEKALPAIPELAADIADNPTPGGVLRAVIEAVKKKPEQDGQEKEELTQLRLEWAQMERAYSLEITELTVRDKESARQREVAINQSEHSSSLSKNISSIIAILVVCCYVVFIYAQLFIKLDFDSRQLIHDVNLNFGNFVFIVLTFYFGQSYLHNKAEIEKKK